MSDDKANDRDAVKGQVLSEWVEDVEAGRFRRAQPEANLTSQEWHELWGLTEFAVKIRSTIKYMRTKINRQEASLEDGLMAIDQHWEGAKGEAPSHVKQSIIDAWLKGMLRG